MRQLATLVALCACWSISGCASGISRPVDFARAQVARQLDHSTDDDEDSVEVEPDAPEPPATPIVTPAPSPVARVAYEEEIATPRAARSAAAPADPDTISRPLAEVSLDIRPSQGELPTDLAAAVFAARAQREMDGPRPGRPEIVVGWTPWTFCYRPLYFEEVALERYGRDIGVFQSTLSAAHFFVGVGLMPYKMVVNPPRSCVCSNGFSRCGDCPPPGYIDYRLHPIAAAVEAGVLAGIVVALP